MPTPRELLAAAKTEITEVTPVTPRASSAGPRSSTSASPTSTTRGRSAAPCTCRGASSSSTSRDGSPTRRARIVVYCAGGVARRSPRGPSRSSATATSLDGGRVRPLEGRRARWRTPPQLTDEQRDRYSRHILLPEVGEEGQPSCSSRRCSCSARAASARPRRSTSRRRASARSASSTWTSSTRRTCSARSSTTRPRRRAQGRLGQEDADRAEPRREGRAVRGAPRRRQRDRHLRGLRRHRRRYRQLPDALPRQRRALFSGKPVVHGSIFRFEGQVTVFDPYVGPCYRCLHPRAAARRARAELPGGRRARRAARHHRLDPGDRGDQAAARHGRAARRAPPHLRRARGVVPDLQGAHATRRARRAASTPARSCIADYDELCMPHPRA